MRSIWKLSKILLDAINKADRSHADFIPSAAARGKDYKTKKDKYYKSKSHTGSLPVFGSIRKLYKKSDSGTLQKLVGGTFKDVLPVEQYFEVAKRLEPQYETLAEIRDAVEVTYAIGKQAFMLLGRKKGPRDLAWKSDGDVQGDDDQGDDLNDRTSNNSNANNADANDAVQEVFTDRATNSMIVPAAASGGNFMEMARVLAGTSTNVNFISVAHVGEGGSVIGGNGSNLQARDIYEAAKAGARDGARDGAERAVARSIKKSQVPASHTKAKDGLNLEDYFSKNNVNAVESPNVENVDSDSDDADDVYNDFEEHEVQVATTKKTAAKEAAVDSKRAAKGDGKNDLPTCAAMKKDGKPCAYKAKFEHNGVHYCGNHFPGK